MNSAGASLPSREPRQPQGADSDTRPLGANPAVSVVIPVRNRPVLVRQAIDSVLLQTFRDFEVIVVDDGSDDNTPIVVAGYAGPVRLIRLGPNGVSAARNAGIAAARGRFIAFLDSDDCFEPDKLERQLALFDARPRVALVYSRYAVSDESTGERWVPALGLRTQGDVYRELLMSVMETPLVTPTVMVRRDLFQVISPFDVGMPIAEDLELWCRIASRFEFGFIDRPLSLIRIHPGNTSGRTTPRQNLDIWSSILQRHFASGDRRLDLVFRRRVWAKLYWIVAEHRRALGEGPLNSHHVRSVLSWPEWARLREVSAVLKSSWSR